MYISRENLADIRLPVAIVYLHSESGETLPPMPVFYATQNGVVPFCASEMLVLLFCHFQSDYTPVSHCFLQYISMRFVLCFILKSIKITFKFLCVYILWLSVCIIFYYSNKIYISLMPAHDQLYSGQKEHLKGEVGRYQNSCIFLSTFESFPLLSGHISNDCCTLLGKISILRRCPLFKGILAVGKQKIHFIE